MTNVPLEVGKTYIAKCVDLNHEGMGVFKVNDFVIFSSGVIIGEKVKLEVTKVTKNYALAKVTDFIIKSPSRVKPICKYFCECGGCDLMHMDYATQLKFKENMVLRTISKFAKLNDFEYLGIKGAKNIYYYRNKVQIPFSFRDGKTICGFYKKKSHNIIPLDECFIEPDISTDISKFIKNLCNEYHIKGYIEESGEGIIRHVLVRNTFLNKYMVIIVSKTKDVPNISEITKKIVNRYNMVESVILNVQEKKTNVILGDYSEVLFGKDEIIDEILGYKFKLSHKSFLQINHEQTEELYKIIREFADLKKDEVLLDAYCGVGTIGITLASSCKEVYGIEIVEDAINNAKENAKLNGFDNCKYFVGRSEEIINDLEVEFDVAVFDPPRKGCDMSFLEAIVKKQIKKIVYVSCNVATLARDLNYLKDYYNVTKVKCCDLFPNSVHVESVCLLTNRAGSTKK